MSIVTPSPSKNNLSLALSLKKSRRLQPHHLHFAHGWLWGVLVAVIAFFVYIGIAKGYFHYWFNEDFHIVNMHESVQSTNEAKKLEDVMRKTAMAKMLLAGIPKEALYYNGEKGFTAYQENNKEILKIQEEDPDKFIAFCTLDPNDANFMAVAKACVAKGAKGFKLYNGHSFFYNPELPLNHERFDSLYSYLESNELPLIFHVNAGNYQEEFESVLKRFPNMKVLCPHFCLSSKNLQRLSYLFDNYPNLYTDMSWGKEEFLFEGLKNIDKNPQKYNDFITKYADRFLFGTDVVVTDYEGKNKDWLTQMFQLYRDLLEKEKVTVFWTSQEEKFSGLKLDFPVLEKIYEKNWKRFMGIDDIGTIQAFLLQFFK